MFLILRNNFCRKLIHYKNFKIQPIDFIQENELGFCEGNIIKYICRYKNKNKDEDLDKIIHYVQLLKRRL